jgi:predicted transcriptional regulator
VASLPIPASPLGPLEAEVMEVLWRGDEATVRTVVEALNAAAAKPRAYTTVMTTLHRLYRKGLLSRHRDGSAHVYGARVSRAAYREARTRATIEALLAQYGDAAYVAMARCIQRQRSPR